MRNLFFVSVAFFVFSGTSLQGFAQQLKNAVRQAYEDCGNSGRQPTIYDVHEKYKALLGNRSDAPLSIIDDLVDMEMFSPDPGSVNSLDEFLDGVVVISLAALGQDDRTGRLRGAGLARETCACVCNPCQEPMVRPWCLRLIG